MQQVDLFTPFRRHQHHMPVCLPCNRQFSATRYLHQHQKTCPDVLQQSKQARESAQRTLGFDHPPHKRAKIGALNAPRSPVISEALGESWLNTAAGTDEGTYLNDAAEPPTTTRSGRPVKATWKIRDQLPEPPGHVDESTEPETVAINNADGPGPQVRRVRLLLTERIRTAANRFHLSRLYKRRPVQQPDPSIDLHTVYVPTASRSTQSRTKRAISQIVAPYPNFSSFLWGRHFWLRGSKKSMNDCDELQSIVVSPNFSRDELKAANFNKINAQLAAQDVSADWVCAGEGWKQASVTIGLPSGQKATHQSRKTAAAEQRRLDRTEGSSNIPADVPIEGDPLTIRGLWHKDLCAEIKNTFEKDAAAARFTFDPYLMYHSRPDSTKAPEPVYSDMMNSPAMVEEDVRLQNSPLEPGCSLPRAVVPLMFWSDATHVARYGKTKAWPAYMYFGNQSKYERARPTCNAAHHIAFFPSLPDDIQDRIQRAHGKSGSTPLLTHLRRELFHACWHVLLDDKFVEAYEHGIVVQCADGIERRLYPRVATYSADYPEKMLIATLRDKGQQPCPHCLVTFAEIPELGTPADRQLRKDRARKDTATRQSLIRKARELIYQDGYVVNSEKVNELLKSTSAVPTINAFSARLCHLKVDFHRMLVPDLLHEIELGIWKGLYSHLIRMLHSIHADRIQELNFRFRHVPTFGPTTIRRFAGNASEMTNIAARDFEDLLQCAIPCFEGLFPSPDDNHIMSLLYTFAYWHGLVKMRLHTESSVILLDDACTALGTHLRHFQEVICPRYITKETDREYAARVRAQLRTAAGDAGSTTTHVNSGRRLRTFNIGVIKGHLLGYYAVFIREFGTAEAFSSELGEREHTRVKGRSGRTNNREREGQMAKIDVRETRLHRMTDELLACGVQIPGCANSVKLDTCAAGPEVHHWIAQESSRRNAVYLGDLHRDHPGDPTLENFTLQLREHLRERLWAESDYEPSHLLSQRNSIRIKDDRIYIHATARINFTTYDIQRDQDLIHGSTDLSGFQYDKSGVLVASRTDTSPLPWLYAVTLAVFHANVILPDLSEHRLDFLWVRWMHPVPGYVPGPITRRLECVRLCDLDQPNATGFVDPASIIRGFHFIPAFHHGRWQNNGSASIANCSDSNGHWKSYYINRFVDRDTLARHTGMSVGSLELQSKARETFPDLHSLVEELQAARAKAAPESDPTTVSEPVASFTDGITADMDDEFLDDSDDEPFSILDEAEEA